MMTLRKELGTRKKKVKATYKTISFERLEDEDNHGDK
jgi:hypothetical protein